MTRLAVSGQSCFSMHHSTPRILILTRCPALQKLQRAAEHRFLVPVKPNPRCCVRRSGYHIYENQTQCLCASILYSWWTETRVHACRLSVNRAPPGKPPSPLLHWRQHAGRNKSLDDIKRRRVLSHAKLSLPPR